MTVATLLSDKPKLLVTIQKDTSLTDAACLLHKHKIGAVLVVDDKEKLCGIFTERDLVRALGESAVVNFGSCFPEPVSKHMVSNVQTCTPEDSVNDIMVMMTKGRFRHVPVLDKGELVGMVSIGDVVKNRIATLELESSAMRDYIMMG